MAKTEATLKTLINNYLNRDDLTSYTEDFINTCIRKLEWEHDFRHMLVNYSKSLSEDDYVFDNPITNYKKLYKAYVIDTDGNYCKLIKTTFEYAMEEYPDLTDDKGIPLYICEYPEAETSLSPDIAPTLQLMVRPTCDASYTVPILAYQYSPELDASTYTTNWWTENAWQVVLYGSLLEAETFLMNDPRVLLWKGMFEDAKKKLIESEIQEVFAGSHQYPNSDYVT